MIKFFLNLSSFLWVILLYVLDKNIFNLYSSEFLIFLIIFISINIISIGLIKKHTNFLDGTQEISKIYPAYNEHMPAFFAICVVAFSLKNINEYNLIFFFSIVFILFIIFCINNVGYLNPTLYLFGYRIYRAETKNNNLIIIMNYKTDYKKKKLEHNSFIQLDEHTYLIPNTTKKEK
ncbi:putative membrane protein [Campylobacter blaseri]|uniref:Uncharacterized protein n=1 Tax=Campylobacter blaseri TaxID=2042961 RepID=A0A2P8QYJ6_9BACT|nr:hypothetical protein [Campylobacter blaseri]PSM51317.1 hypothetical protein CQ405_08800 [Campylobacter blaseri]PSM52461.1 hypothetical protein CRN67_08805 [Campylobacter blaseri]QKF86207.1 putative membrane protein [Campylobacter blaseri]